MFAWVLVCFRVGLRSLVCGVVASRGFLVNEMESGISSRVLSGKCNKNPSTYTKIINIDVNASQC